MKKLVLIAYCFLGLVCNAQESLSELLKQQHTKSIPYISVHELAMPKTNAIILDAREQNEFNVSHLKNALPVGYDFFELDSVIKNVPNKDGKIVVYCSIGIRSETIAYKLKKAGYKNVFNLYGGIFEWKNNNFPVYNSDGKETENIHVFSEEWSKWLKKGHKVF